MEVSKKDQVIFCNKADHEVPSKYELPPALPNESRRGVLLPNGEINWTCPCLGVLPYGPCGFEFRKFFTCLPPPGSDEPAEQDEAKRQECIPQFKAMMECMSQFPQVYPPDKREDKPTTDEQQQK